MKNFEQGNNSAITNPMDKIKIRVFLIYILIAHTKFQDPISNGSWPSASVTDRRTDERTYLRLYSSLIFYMLKKYPIIQQVPNNTLYFYGLNRIFNVCSFP